MRFKEILSRLTGLNLGPVGASWSPPEPEVSKAKRVIDYLEDRRVLDNRESVEVPEHCVQSVIEIRHFLTHELSNALEDSPLTDSLRAMRAACRKFLSALSANQIFFPVQPGALRRLLHRAPLAPLQNRER